MNINYIKKLLEKNISGLNIERHFDSPNSYIFYTDDKVIKVLRKHKKMTVDELKNAWETEANFCELINKHNSNTVKFVDKGFLPDNIYYIIFERYEGTLHDLYEEIFIKDSKLRVLIVISFLRQMASVIASLKNVGQIHQDIKPKNILYKRLNDNEFNFYLGDFGLLTTYEERVYTTMVGNKYYRAPEQLDHSYVRYGGGLGHKVDIYPLSIICTEILSQGVFKSPNFFSLHNDIPEIDPVLMDLLKKCNKELPKDRIDVESLNQILNVN